MEIAFFPLDIDYADLPSGKPVIRLFGKTSEGERICVFDEHVEPYFYAIVAHETLVNRVMKEVLALRAEEKERVSYVTRAEHLKKHFFGKEVHCLKVFVNSPKDVVIIRDKMKSISGIIGREESDILFYRRYLIDKQITPLLACKAEGEEIPVPQHLLVDRCFNATKIRQEGEMLFKAPKILSLDIEVYCPEFKVPDSKKDPIIMLGLSGENFQKVLTWKKFPNPKQWVEFVSSEAELLSRFQEVLREEKPDYLAGYFTDGFDLPYIEDRAEHLSVNLKPGIDHSGILISKRAGNTTSKIKGIVHLDIFKFIRRVMANTISLTSYDLDNVGKHVLGEGKTGADVEKMAAAWDQGGEALREYCEYNLNDARLAYRLTQVMLPHLNEIVKLLGQPIQDVCRMTYGQLVEWYMIKHSQLFDEIVPHRPASDETYRRRRGYEGAFVFQPNAGLYKDLVVCDFRGLYPSIIVTHNICPTTLTQEKKQSQAAPPVHLGGRETQFLFSYKREGFVPSLLKDIIVRRNRIKELLRKEKKPDPLLKARDYSLKILSNSFYGYLGFPASRWYCLECAASVTAYGRQYIHDVITKARNAGFDVVYSDTDSIFFSLGEKKSKKDALDFITVINRELPSLMELELQGFYPKGLFVMKKGEARGAKKKYALIDEDLAIKVVGFETIRGDWSVIAKETQQKVIEIALVESSKEAALHFVQEVIGKVRTGEIPLEKMVIQKQLRKSIGSYESVGPHVQVAKRMEAMGKVTGPGMIIAYVIEAGKGSIGERARLVHEVKAYDTEYYIKNQILPVVSPILEVLGFSKKALEKVDQKSLGDF